MSGDWAWSTADTRRPKGRSSRTIVPFPALFALALLPRLVAPARFVTWDEPTWAQRSTAFLRALESGDLERTFQREHPGVVTMWAGAVGAALHRSPAAPDGPDDLDAMRAVVALLTALCVAAATMLLVPLVGGRTAGVAGVLLSFDPYLLAHSRVLHVDAIAASLALLAILCTLRWLHAVHADHAGRGIGWRIGAGALIGLAVVEKSPMLVLAAFVGAVVTLRLVGDVVGGRATRREAIGRWLTCGIVLALAAAVTYVAVWPAMWVAPVATFQRMLAYAAEGAGKAREAVFFAGRVSPDPGIALYLAAIPFRMTPLSLVGAAAGCVVAAREARRGRWTGALLLAWAVVFVVAMGFGAKKFERYMLPAIPALDVVAAIGLVAVAEAVRARWPAAARQRLGASTATIALVAALVLQSAAVVAHRPYYLAWYNPLLGGGPAAERVLPIGWGEGSDLVVDWLNGHLPAGSPRRVVSTASDTLVAHRYLGTVVPPKKWRDAEWLVVMVDDRQIGEPEEILAAVGDRAPDHVVRLNGIEYAWIWKRP
ncbi:MAG: phospholipid carrier-dependent glycosyltransferase [Anaerolineae bacterium]